MEDVMDVAPALVIKRIKHQQMPGAEHGTISTSQEVNFMFLRRPSQPTSVTIFSPSFAILMPFVEYTTA